MHSSFPAKILLFGEHTVLYGGRALAVPYERFQAKWQTGASTTDEQLLKFGHYLRKSDKTSWIDVDRFLDDLQAGWYLESNLPFGYGLGSSGTVCAAVYDRYGETADTRLDELRLRLAVMEAHFHGSSSGLDPLVSLLGQPIIVDDGECRPVDLHESYLDNFFLLDTGQKRNSGSIIKDLSTRYKNDDAWRASVRQNWMAPTEQLITALINGPTDASIGPFIKQLSLFQGQHLSHLIPAPIQPVWQSPHYCLKICGAGGGGFLLGYAFDRYATTDILKSNSLLWLNTP